MGPWSRLDIEAPRSAMAGRSPRRAPAMASVGVGQVAARRPRWMHPAVAVVEIDDRLRSGERPVAAPTKPGESHDLPRAEQVSLPVGRATSRAAANDREIEALAGSLASPAEHRRSSRGISSTSTGGAAGRPGASTATPPCVRLGRRRRPRRNLRRLDGRPRPRRSRLPLPGVGKGTDNDGGPDIQPGIPGHGEARRSTSADESMPAEPPGPGGGPSASRRLGLGSDVGRGGASLSLPEPPGQGPLKRYSGVGCLGSTAPGGRRRWAAESHEGLEQHCGAQGPATQKPRTR